MNDKKPVAPPPSATEAVPPPRPERFKGTPIAPIPTVDGANADSASVEYSHYRTGLSRHRTGLSEHRTDLSEFRTDLSQHRTDLSDLRTDLSKHRTNLSEHRTTLSDNRTEMSMRRTGMSFQRTRMSADRTLMSEMRTSLSLIGFGFTIYQTFAKLVEAGIIRTGGAPRNFGVALLVLGVVLLVGGIVRHVQFLKELRLNRATMLDEGLIHAQSTFPISISLLVAVALLIVGLTAIASIAFKIPIFG